MEEFQRALLDTNICDYTIDEFDGDTLVLKGSFDLAYYYEVIITFREVDYINCPVYFDTDRIRLSSTEEREKYRVQCQLEKEDLMIVFVQDVLNTFYFVICQDFGI